MMGTRLVVKALNSFKLIGGAETNVCSKTLFFLDNYIQAALLS